MKRGCKSLAMILVVSLIFLQGAVAFAQPADVADSYWGKDAINKAVEREILMTYADNTVKPTETVTSIELLVGIYRTAESLGLLKGTNINTLGSKYEDKFEGYNIPKMIAPYGGEVYPALAFALDRNIVSEAQLAGFVKDGQLLAVKKVEATTYIGKFINSYKSQNINVIFSLSHYKDDISIKGEDRQYVNFLNGQNVISKTGDENGNFSPDSEINRTIMAILLNGTYDSLNGFTAGSGDDKTETPDDKDDASTPTTPTDQVNVIVGTISDIYLDLDLVKIRTKDQVNHGYDISEAKYVYQGKPTNKYAMIIGQDVEVTVRGDKIQIVEIQEEYEKITGTVVTFNGPFTEPGEVYNMIRLRDDKGQEHFKKIKTTTFIYLDHHEGGYEDIKVGDYVEVGYEGLQARTVEVFKKSAEFEGILNKSLSSNRVALSITLDDGTIFDTALDQTVVFINTEYGFGKGDIVRVKTKFGKITTITAIGESKNIAGEVYEIHITKEPTLKIKYSNNTYETFDIASGVEVYNLNGEKGGTIYSLRLGMQITGHVGVGGITEINMTETSEKTNFKGDIKAIYKATKLMVITKEDKSTITVSFANASNINVGDYEVGDTVYVNGVDLGDNFFDADAIVTLD